MKTISDIRTILMGVSILWVMIYHTTGLLVYPAPIGIFASLGFCGVDIFFFVSAYGLYYSMQKGLGLCEWYKRRLVRVLPAFLIVSVSFGLLTFKTFDYYWKESLMLGFYIPTLRYAVLWWYIPAILLFYLFFPFLYSKKAFVAKHLFLLILASFSIAYIYSIVKTELHWSSYWSFFLTRIPVCFCGLVYADSEEKCRKHFVQYRYSKYVVYFFSFLFFLFLLYGSSVITFEFRNEVLIILSLPFICCIAGILKRLRFIGKILYFCGNHSLELYLLHICIIHLTLANQVVTNSLHPVLPILGAILLSCFLAYLVRTLLNYLVLKCKIK